MNRVTGLTMMLLMLLGSNDLKGKDEFPILKGAYLGQKPPGMVPEIFAW